MYLLKTCYNCKKLKLWKYIYQLYEHAIPYMINIELFYYDKKRIESITKNIENNPPKLIPKVKNIEIKKKINIFSMFDYVLKNYSKKIKNFNMTHYKKIKLFGDVAGLLKMDHNKLHHLEKQSAPIQDILQNYLHHQQIYQ